jgi:hypothetical protein
MIPAASFMSPETSHWIDLKHGPRLVLLYQWRDNQVNAVVSGRFRPFDGQPPFRELGRRMVRICPWAAINRGRSVGAVHLSLRQQTGPITP